MLIAVMSVYEEEMLLGRAIDSLRAGGVERIHVFDGAWSDFDEDNALGLSRDATAQVAIERACVWHEPERKWESQEEKRTVMFHQCGATVDDHVLVFDADEELEGSFTPLARGQHYNLMVKCVGPNDLPGIRGEWPNGDYYPDYKPELRVFAWSEYLVCRWPGGYFDGPERIEAYANYAGAPLLPVVGGVSFLHHGNDRSEERRLQKIAFYEKEHPRRAKRQRELLG